MVPWQMCEDHPCKGRAHQAIQVPLMQQQESASLILKGGGLILTPCYSSKLKILTPCNSLMLNSANYLVGQVLCWAILAQHMYSVLWSWESRHLNMLNIW